MTSSNKSTKIDSLNYFKESSFLKASLTWILTSLLVLYNTNRALGLARH